MDWWRGECTPSRFPSTLKISVGLRPREISRVLRYLLGVGDGFPNASLILVEHGYPWSTDIRIQSMSLALNYNFQRVPGYVKNLASELTCPWFSFQSSTFFSFIIWSSDISLASFIYVEQLKSFYKNSEVDAEDAFLESCCSSLPT